MRQIYSAGVTPQQKMVSVNQKFGNTGIQDQQGTTRLIYDTLPLTAATANTVRFFENSASRSFPFTNCGSDGNKLGVGNTMTINSISFYLLSYDAVDQRFESYVQITAVPQLLTGLINFEIANNRVIKDLSLLELSANFDKNVGAQNDSTIELDTDIVIPPLLNFVCEARFGYIAALAGYTHIRCVINGAAGIIAPRTTF